MSIQIRLNAVIAALLIFCLAGLVVTKLIQARPRILTETTNMLSFTKDYIETARTGILASPDPSTRMRELATRLEDARHIEVALLPPGEAKINVPQTPQPTTLQWLESLTIGDVDPQMIAIPFKRGMEDFGSIAIATSPFNKLRELSVAIEDIIVTGLLLALAAFGLTSWVIWRALRPVHELCDAIALMEAGHYDIDLTVSGTPEITAISRSVKSLASALRKAQRENANLSIRLIQLQDDERRAIARELHDELGPHLYAARVRGTAMKSELAKAEPDISSTAQMAEKLLEEINTLQLVNRRVLHQLAPAALRELGLTEALQDLADRWREEHSTINLTLSVGLPTDISLDETTELTIYRIVQECLTNAYRHAHASNIAVEIMTEPFGNNGPAQLKSEKVIRATVIDDGKGMSNEIDFGYGLRGMQERITALGGKIIIGKSSIGGTELLAILPLPNSLG